MTSESPLERQAKTDLLFESVVRATLDMHGLADWRLQPGDAWCVVAPAARRSRIQGWKLHVSATPLSAPVVLARAADVLARRRCTFKFAPTIRRVERLGAGTIDRGTGGKFITAYPDMDDLELQELADELHEATAGLPGPGILSDRQYQPGSLVYYRYGVFSGVHLLGNDGGYESMLVTPDGRLETDQRKAWFSPPSWVPRDPLRQGEPPSKSVETAARSVRLHDRYVVSRAIRHTFKGGIFRAVDTTSGADVVIKQGRAHAGATTSGRDTQAKLRNEAVMLRLLETTNLPPRLIEVFEQQGDLFVVQEAIQGATLGDWVRKNTVFALDGTWGPPVHEVRRISCELVDLIELIHGRNLVLVDLSPGNVMIDETGRVRLIDLEALARTSDRIDRVHTPGFGAPEHISALRGGMPQKSADLYSLGAVLFYPATGVRPNLCLDEPTGRSAGERLDRWLEAMAADNPAARWLRPAIRGLLTDDPAARPEPAALQRIFEGDDARDPDFVRRQDFEISLDHVIDDGLAFIVEMMGSVDDERLWPVGENVAGPDLLNVQHGAAGVLGVLTQAFVVEQSADLRDAVSRVLAWMHRRVYREPRLLPGLYFGRAGTAWALLDAGQALGDQRTIDLAHDLARRIPLEWPNPDVYHGAAGSGLTQVYFWEQSGDQLYLDRAAAVANRLNQVMERDVNGLAHWPVPADFQSVFAGKSQYGYAHGIAGIGMFLLAAARATGSDNYLEAAQEAGRTLVAVAQEKEHIATWSAGATDSGELTMWCNGSAGVGAYLARLWAATGDKQFLELAQKAAAAVWRTRWQSGTSYCCGVTGQGEFLLDMADALGDERYRAWATDLATGAYQRHTVRSGRDVLPDQSDTDVVVNFGFGVAGPVAYFRRLRDGGPRLWLPKAANWS